MKNPFLFIAFILFSISSLYAEKKTALIIGNGAYSNFPSLSNPKTEAINMKNALQDLGFEVILVTDGSEDDIYDAITDFEYKLNQNGGLAFFHYGGHGVQSRGDNYLIPVDAIIPDEMRLKSRAINVSDIVGTMEASKSSTNIIILDACRDNPLPASTRSGSSRGLAKTNAPENSIIIYSAEAGEVARDGIFTPIFLKYIQKSGLSLRDIMMNVRKEVRIATGGKQRPGEYSMLEEEIFLAGMRDSSVNDRNLFRPLQVIENMVFVEGGNFQMGSISGYDREKPLHNVSLNSYWILDHEVTQEEYFSIIGENPSKHIGRNLPVENVSWYDAVEFCNALSQIEGLVSCYYIEGEEVVCNFDANGYRLPTEAEWEYAARSRGKDYKYSWGNGSPIGNISDESIRSFNMEIWKGYNDSYKFTSPVSSFTANELGLYDMSGNVFEWCWDWYGDYLTTTQSNPTGSTDGSYRIIRGGNYMSNLKSLHCTSRWKCSPNSNYYFSGVADYYIGFRLVRNK